MKIAIKTLGCKSNRADSDRLIEELLGLFGSVANIVEVNNASDISANSDVDVCIVNTCTVTHVADRKSRSSARLLRKTYPSAKIIVMGCGPKVDKGDYEALDSVDFVGKSSDEVLDYLKGCEFDGASARLSPRPVLGVNGVRTRSVLKIQDGCNNFCTYCIIPFARGRERSVPYSEVIAGVDKMVGGGFREVVLTGINIGNWEGVRGGEKLNIAQLIKEILYETKVNRLRLSSIEPQNFVEDFEDLLMAPEYRDRFCPHFHMSLQSGSDKILELMNRHYSRGLYKKVAHKLKKLRPEVALTTDVIVGFPGESDKDFQDTVKFVKEVGFSKVHVFPYSKRKGTRAVTMDDQVAEDVKKVRARELQGICEEMRASFVDGQIGSEHQVLFEQKVRGRGDAWEGFTPNYIKIEVESDEDLLNEIRLVRLEEPSDNPGNKKAPVVRGQLI